MKRKTSTKSIPPDFDKEVKELKILLKEAQARLAPREEITEEVWEEIRKIREFKSKLS